MPASRRPNGQRRDWRVAGFDRHFPDVRSPSADGGGGVTRVSVCPSRRDSVEQWISVNVIRKLARDRLGVEGEVAEKNKCK